MPRHTRLAPAILVIVFLLSLSGLAQAPPTADTFALSGDPNSNHGADPSLLVQKGQVTSAGYLQFDLSALPSGASVSKATLRLFVNQVTVPGKFRRVPTQRQLD